MNTIDFQRVNKELYVCGSCGLAAERIYCGCIKCVEFDKDTQVLTYWHQGDHICVVKPNVKE